MMRLLLLGAFSVTTESYYACADTGESVVRPIALFAAIRGALRPGGQSA